MHGDVFYYKKAKSYNPDQFLGQYSQDPGTQAEMIFEKGFPWIKSPNLFYIILFNVKICLIAQVQDIWLIIFLREFFHVNRMMHSVPFLDLTWFFYRDISLTTLYHTYFPSSLLSLPFLSTYHSILMKHNFMFVFVSHPWLRSF